MSEPRLKPEQAARLDAHAEWVDRTLTDCAAVMRRESRPGLYVNAGNANAWAMRVLDLKAEVEVLRAEVNAWRAYSKEHPRAKHKGLRHECALFAAVTATEHFDKTHGVASAAASEEGK